MRVLTVLEKEFLEILRNRMLLFTILLLPLIFVAIPLAVLYFMGNQPPKSGDLEIYRRMAPEFANMNPMDVVQIVMMGQFMLFLLMVPVITPLNIATFSIIGEKQARSLEPLLATPIRTWELLLGKTLAAVLPAIGATWISYLLVLAGMAILASPVVFASAASGMWMLAMIVIAPLLAILGVSMGVLVSSRVNDTRVAQQIGAVVILPLIGLGIAQSIGKILFSLPMFAAGAVAIAAIDVAVLVAAVKLFDRETILTRWR